MTTTEAEESVLEKLWAIHQASRIVSLGASCYGLVREHAPDQVGNMGALIYELAQLRGEKSIDRIIFYKYEKLLPDIERSMALKRMLVHVLGALPSDWVDKLIMELKRHAVQQGGFTELLESMKERGMCSKKECVGKHLASGEIPLFPLDDALGAYESKACPRVQA
jgi:hypothetical protein